MSLSALTSEEREVVRRMMAATFEYFDFDFQTRLGVFEEEKCFKSKFGFSWFFRYLYIPVEDLKIEFKMKNKTKKIEIK